MITKKQKILIIGIIATIAILFSVVVLWDGLPLYGWTYSEPITEVYHEQYVDGSAGVDWRVYVETSGINEPIVHVAVYGAVTYPGAKYSLRAEGYFDTINQTFEWTTSP